MLVVMVAPSWATRPRGWLYKDLILQRKSAANRVTPFQYSHTEPVGELDLGLDGALEFPLFPYPRTVEEEEDVGGVWGLVPGSDWEERGGKGKCRTNLY